MVRSGISPEINAVSTLLLVATSLLLLAAYRLEQGHGRAQAAMPGLLGRRWSCSRPSCWAAPASGETRAEPLHLVRTTSPPRRCAKFEARHGVRVNVDLYDTNEALLAKVQAGNVGLRRALPLQLSDRGAAEAEPAAARSTTRRCRTSRTSTRASSTATTTAATATPSPTSGAPAASPTTRSACRRRLVGRALGPALSRAHPDARRPARGLRRRAQVEGPERQRDRPRAAARGADAFSRAEAPGPHLQLLELRGRAALGRRLARPGLERPVRARRWSRTPTSST